MTEQGKPSLRARVVRHIMVPLGLTWLAGTLVALSVASYFTAQAFDRALLDDAYSVAANVRSGDDTLQLALSPREVNTVLFDQVESLFFAVRRIDGALIAGEPWLQTSTPPAAANHVFVDTEYRSTKLRAVTLRINKPAAFLVVVAQTTQSRTSLLEQLLLYSIGPQILLLVLLAMWLRRAIGSDLRPLSELQMAVDQRDAYDLTPVPVSATTRDVERLAIALNALLERVGQSVRAQREFAGNVAHELRTPLAGIGALAEYGLAQQDPQAWREQLAGIARSQARASHLVDQLLALALAAEAKAGIRLQEVALEEIVRDAVLRFLSRADAAGIDLGARGLEQSTHVLGDPTLIEGIVNNLLDNALRYGRAGGSEPTAITVAISQTTSGTALSVIDNGPGISAEVHAHLMGRWAQGEAGQLLGQGVGLGLPIVAQYAGLMQARLELKPGPQGRGLTASVVFANIAASP
ncbi:MAG: sensor histidine kinase N-terminal domain-containing protein [Burkholderiaceae bacterium]|nr:sensor histidine kinase N-terminal domain-containing protein [Burkholderiaceae bacterium]MDO9088558.1 sensor histidine kinase N-terminal domain-containing protein [Burkholderiaceae bacterium]